MNIREEIDKIRDEGYNEANAEARLCQDMCEGVSAIPDVKMYPKIDKQDEILKQIQTFFASTDGH